MHSIIVENLSNATFYSESDIWSAIDNFSASLANIKVASPYISNKVRFNWKVGDLLLIALSDINVRKGFVNPFVVEEVMNQGVKVYSNEKLHAKIYSNNERAVICSYNLSYASQNQWLEAGVLVTDTGNLEKVTAFFDDN